MAEFATSSPRTSLTLVSFWWGGAYYRHAAENLKADCDKWGVAHHIVEASLPAESSWIDVCRFKITFIAECWRLFEGAILWMDVDCRLLRKPVEFAAVGADIGFFLRGFREIREFDPVILPRVIEPSFLFLGASDRSRAFIDLASALEQAFEGQATDDFFWHEAWRRFESPLSTWIFPTDWIVLETEVSEASLFRFGRSGKAGEFKPVAEQHAVEMFVPQRLKAVFLREADLAARQGDAGLSWIFLKKAQSADPEDVPLAQRVAADLVSRGQEREASALIAALPVGELGESYGDRFQVDAAMSRGDLSAAERLAAEMMAHGSAVDADWAQSRMVRIGLDKRARSRWIPSWRRPALSWMEGPYPGNFGDILNPYLVEHLSGRPPRRVPFGDGILAIGSTIKFAKRGTIVWGAGTPRIDASLSPDARYIAVRGPLTRALVLKAGGQCPPVFGDPAALLPLIYRPRHPKARFKLGVVWHHAHLNRIECDASVKQISVLRSGYRGIEAFIDELHECESILSTSLHGLIVAHAYGIPARWCDIESELPGVPGDGTKFNDYLMSVGLPDCSPMMLKSSVGVSADLATLVDELPARRIDLDALIDAAPFRLDRRWRKHDAI